MFKVNHYIVSILRAMTKKKGISLVRKWTEEAQLNRHFTKGIQRASKHEKMMSLISRQENKLKPLR